MLNLDSKIEQMTFSEFLEKKFLEWQQREGGRRTVKEFAAYIGVSQSTISTWWNDMKKPEGENLLKLAFKFGLEVYDVLGKPRPDIDLHYIQASWDSLSPSASSQRSKSPKITKSTCIGRCSGGLSMNMDSPRQQQNGGAVI